MSGGAAEDPSMDDILASIRRILDDDQPPATETTAVASQTDGAPSGRPELLLDDTMLEPPNPTSMQAFAQLAPLGDPAPAQPLPEVPTMSQPSAPEPPPEPAEWNLPEAAPVTTTLPQTDGLLGARAQSDTASSLSNLMRTVATERSAQVTQGGPTIEDIVREEIRPLLKTWLDTHLPSVVERLVRAEIERVVARL